MRKAYVVTRDGGNRADVVGVFDSRAAAQEFVDICAGEVDDFIVELVVNAPGVRREDGLLRYLVWMGLDGSGSASLWFENEEAEGVPELVIGISDSVRLRQVVWAASDADALRVVNEARLQLIGEGKWRR